MSSTTTQISFWTVPVKIQEVIEASSLKYFRLKKLPENKPYSLERVSYGSGHETLRAVFSGGEFVEFLPKKEVA